MTSTVTEFRLPDVGEGLTEAEIVAWHVAVGDTVGVNDVLVEVETTKSVVELPSPAAGTVTAVHVAVGETVPVGTVIVSLSSADEAVTAPADEAPLVLVGTGPSAPEARRRRLGPSATAVAERRAPTTTSPATAVTSALAVDVTATVELCARLGSSRRWSQPVTLQLVLDRAVAVAARRHGARVAPTVMLGAVQEQAGVVGGQVVPRLVAEVSITGDERFDPAEGAAVLADVAAILRDPAEAMVLGT